MISKNLPRVFGPLVLVNVRLNSVILSLPSEVVLTIDSTVLS